MMFLAAVQEKLFTPVLLPDVDLKANPLVRNKHRRLWAYPVLGAVAACELPHKLQTESGASPQPIACFPLVQNSDWNEAEAVEPASRWLRPRFSGRALP